MSRIIVTVITISSASLIFYFLLYSEASPEVTHELKTSVTREPSSTKLEVLEETTVAVKDFTTSYHETLHTFSEYDSTTRRTTLPTTSTMLPVTSTITSVPKCGNHKLFTKTAAKGKIVFYNRLKKCGSRSLYRASLRVARLNKFSVRSSVIVADEHPNTTLMNREITKIALLKAPAFYNRHIHYLDFAKRCFTQPIYINMIRDPVARFVSHFNYWKYGDYQRRLKDNPRNFSDINQCILADEPFCVEPYMTQYYADYFCGFDWICNKSLTDKIRLAKKHIDDNYLVIGMTEEFEIMLQLLEKMIPEYFRGILREWRRIGKYLKTRSKTIMKDVLNDAAYHKLRYKLLAQEYVVFEHAKTKYERLKTDNGIS